VSSSFPATTPSHPYGARSHGDLAELARELLLAGHLIDRSGMPHLISRFGREGMTEIAIDEWMAASPVYTKRMQRILGFEGDDVATIFKGMQLDIGAPPEFMDFRYRVHDSHHGEFWLDHCGALMDVEPMGDEYVTAMCHTIEDPTFDATATATNPRAQVRPMHRPPRAPADRHPHCHWTVTIEEGADPLPYPPQAELLGSVTAAAIPLAERPGDLPADDGDATYEGEVDPDLVMERFSSATLAAICDELALQGHLLSQGFMLHVAERAGGDEALEIGSRQLTGIAGLTSKRLAASLGVAADLDGVAAVLAVHPIFLPRSYVDLHLDRTTEGAELRLSLGPCPALAQDDGLTWPAILVDSDDSGLAAAVTCIAPRARVTRVDPSPGAAATWDITIDPDAPPADQPTEVTLAEFSTGASFTFERRG
jgi:hypothetical protein